MCLAVPGRVIDLDETTAASAAGPVGTVDFQGSRLQVGLAFTPEARVGDWVLVHAGYALSLLDEAEARETWQMLREANLVDDIPEFEQAGQADG